MSTKLKTIFNYTDQYSFQHATINVEPDLTEQSHAQDVDINVIVKRFTKTGQLPNVNIEALYGDFTDVPDYRTAMDKIRAADEAFGEIPAHIRKEFDNDPAKFIEFAHDPKNADKLREWGLANPLPEPPQSKNVATRYAYDDDGEHEMEPPRETKENGNRQRPGTERSEGHRGYEGRHSRQGSEGLSEGRSEPDRRPTGPR